MSKERTWLDDVHDSSSVIREISYDLTKLSNAFEATGNDIMRNHLSYMAESIMAAEETINHAIGGMLSDQVNAGNKQIGVTLKALLTSHA